MKIMDLNDDCQLLMLEGLDFPTLLGVAETNKHFTSIVSNICQRIFTKKDGLFSTYNIFW